ncbi:chemotaxis response regulator protein-glutamate methylesterase [Treponema sp. C6A8]|jgi:two-component system chemotaxis response regulator CheB|uniref:protein-glutamate methylesterase/protein-glutamine glutaminase n=1 Tax=Treponema sp. C6A8 TaxID=1410609 RepID=UPI000486417F|nr:chemotaxis response regulator protein-glutamate methylesterase [Treponema sp. C6A8]
MDDISVLVCDDSALMRNLIGRIVDETTGLKVCGKAENGQDLLDKIPQCNPDVILLDIEMPVMNGVEFLKKRKEQKIKVPVIILSSVATEGAKVTMQCLELGASDFITKPGGSSVTLKIADVSSEIIEYIASYGGAYASAHGKEIPEADFFTQQVKLREAQRQVVLKKGEEAAKNFTIQKTDLPASSLWNKPKLKEPVTITPARSGGKIELIAIGISTGGPNALRDVFKMIDPRLKQPVMVVQHMPAGFTKEFAASLNNICPLTVTEGVDGEKIEGGHVYIAPGGYHMFVEHRADGNYVKLSQDEQRNGHRPSADVLFESVAKIYQNNALGVIMTGMGRDGAAELAEMRKQGAYTLGQDQASSIVYGMPKVAFELGGVQKQVPLMQMADEISKLAREHC